MARMVTNPRTWRQDHHHIIRRPDNQERLLIFSLTARAALDSVASVESTAESNMNARAERLNQLAGSDQVAKVRIPPRDNLC
jgi:hypothetical protein